MDRIAREADAIDNSDKFVSKSFNSSSSNANKAGKRNEKGLTY